MKKRWICCAAAFLLTFGAAAQAEEYVTLAELREQVKDGWHETYQAHGREVVADADLQWMTESNTCPIVEVEALGMEEGDSRFDKYRGEKYADIYTRPAVISVDVLNSKSFYRNQGARYGGKIWEDEEDEIRQNGERPTGTPENVDLSYDEFLDRIDGDLEHLTGLSLANFHINEVKVSHISYKTITKSGMEMRGDPLVTCGGYFFNASQLFQGIPMLNNYLGVTTPGGQISYAYCLPDYYYFSFKAVRELGVVQDDVPLLSFEAFTGKLEELIDAGKLRGVDELAFGYLPFSDGHTWKLCPAWRINGGYTEDPNAENVMPYVGEEGCIVVPETYNSYYFNAQTGEILPMRQVMREDKYLAMPDVLTWTDVK